MRCTNDDTCVCGAYRNTPPLFTPNQCFGPEEGTIGVCVGTSTNPTVSSQCLLFCVIVFFEKMGIIIIINAVGSLFFALCFFPALLSIGGGGAQRGDVRVEARDEEEASIAVEVEMTAGEPRQRGPSGSSLW